MSDQNASYKRFEPRPSDGVAPFEPGEVFFSRTDTRGVILAGNYVFRRVAHHEWDDLIGAPHKLIRHPDMPAGMFHIIWERLKRGQTVGAYIKNLSKDGLHYWAFAVLTKWKTGFLAASIKPTSARVQQIEALYAEARQRELDTGATPKDSAESILASLKQIGFERYQDFASDSLSEELQSERRLIGLPSSLRIQRACEMLEHVQTLGKKTEALLLDFEALTSVPRNLQIKAKDIEPSGGPLTALSTDYERMSQEMSVWFLKHVTGADNDFEKIAYNVKDALLFQSSSELFTRCHEQLVRERRDLGTTALDQECDTLKELSAHITDLANVAAHETAKEADRLTKACNEMRRTLMGLNTVRVTGKIENARLDETSGDLGEIIAQLGESQRKVEDHLARVRVSVDAISACVRANQIITDPPVTVDMSYEAHMRLVRDYA